MNMLFQQLARTVSFALLPVAIAVAAGTASSPAWAQFEDVAEAIVPDRNLGHRGQFQVSESYLDQRLFGGSSQGKQHRERLDAMVALQLDRYDAICQLSPKQQNLLRLAAQGDVKRLDDAIVIVRKKFNVARFDQQKFSNIIQEIEPLRVKIQNGIFDESSLLQKVVEGVLDQQQIAKFEQADLERRNSIYRAKIGLFLAQLQNGVPMLAEQREQFTTLLLEETRAPKRYGQYAYYIVMLNVSKLPEKKMKAIFDDAQWRAVKQSFDQARGMEHHLKGLLD